jgi:hypothetical protein
MIESQLDFSTRDILAKKSEFDAASDKSIDMDFSYKLGVRLFNSVKVTGHVGMKYFGFSGGVQIPTSDDVRDISLLYQMAIPYGGAYPAHSFMAGAEFGQREKKLSKRDYNVKRVSSLQICTIRRCRFIRKENTGMHTGCSVKFLLSILILSKMTG